MNQLLSVTPCTLIFAGDFLPRAGNALPAFVRTGQLVANLECVLTRQSAVFPKSYSLTIPPEAIDAIGNDHFQALSVANNHALDAGPSGLREMLALLRDSTRAEIYGTRRQPYAVVENGRSKSAIIGCLERCRVRGNLLFPEEHVESLIKRIRSEFDHIFVTPHWGKYGEFGHHPSPGQIRVANRWLDAGASGIFGHHPHTIHGRIVQAGRPVYFSLGSLWFPHDLLSDYPASRIGLAVGVTMTEGRDLVCREMFLLQTFDSCELLADQEQKLCDELMRRMSHVLSATWTLPRWARAVGPIYVRKSDASWRLRRVQHGVLRTAPRQLVWNLLPTTVLLRLASLVPDAVAQRLKRDFEELAETFTAAAKRRSEGSFPLD